MDMIFQGRSTRVASSPPAAAVRSRMELSPMLPPSVSATMNPAYFLDNLSGLGKSEWTLPKAGKFKGRSH